MALEISLLSLHALFLDSHDRAIIGIVVGQRSVHVEVANAAIRSVSPVPRATTVSAERDSVGARGITHAPSKTVAVGVRAVDLVTAVDGNTGTRCELKFGSQNDTFYADARGFFAAYGQNLLCKVAGIALNRTMAVAPTSA